VHIADMGKKPKPALSNRPTALPLVSLRESRGFTQLELALASGMGQSELSKAERRSDHRVSTLRRYVSGLGGRLEIAARFGRRRVLLRGV